MIAESPGLPTAGAPVGGGFSPDRLAGIFVLTRVILWERELVSALGRTCGQQVAHAGSACLVIRRKSLWCPRFDLGACYLPRATARCFSRQLSAPDICAGLTCRERGVTLRRLAGEFSPDCLAGIFVLTRVILWERELV